MDKGKMMGTVYVVVMQNILSHYRSYDKIYDLKGSAYERYTITDDPKKPLKDLNFLEDSSFIYLNHMDSKFLRFQLLKDCKFLQEHSIMDYSLLLGIR